MTLPTTSSVQPSNVPVPVAAPAGPDNGQVAEAKPVLLPQGAGGPRPSRLPKAKPWSKRAKILLGAAVAVLLLTVGGATWYLVAARRSIRTDLVTHRVRYERLELNVVERGALESVKNSDIYCTVKARSQGSTVAGIIKWLIDEGSEVQRDRPKKEARTIVAWDEKSGTYIEKPGDPQGWARVLEVPDKDSGRVRYADLLVELDSSGLEEQLKAEKISLDNAQAASIAADENYKIVESQNASDRVAAKNALTLAAIDLVKYVKTDLPQAVSDVDGRIKIFESNLEMQRERVAWVLRMVKKGYQTQSQAESEQSKLQSCQLDLKKVNLEKAGLIDERTFNILERVGPVLGRLEERDLADLQKGLEELQKGLEGLSPTLAKRTVTDCLSKYAEKKLDCERVEHQAKAKEATADADRKAKRSVYEQEAIKYKEIMDEIKKCQICAPQDGMVVYFVPEQARYGAGMQQSIVAQGEPAREGQKLMQIPDLKHMLVNTKVHEALVSRVRGDVADKDGNVSEHGQPAVVRLDSYPDRRLRAHIKSVATMASQQDFFSADVKVYTTKVEIDEPIDGLKPGMSAEVTITIGDPLERVLTVPIQAIVGSVELGATRKVFVMTPEGPQERSVLIGEHNVKMVEIRDGLKEGDEVVLNPKVLVGEKAKTRSAPGEDKPSSEKGSREEGQSPGGDRGPGGKRSPESKRGQGQVPGDFSGMGPDGPPMAGQRVFLGPSGPGGSGGPPGGGDWNSPEARKWQQEQMEKVRKASPEERKKMLDNMPADRRDRVKERWKKEGLKVAD